MSNGGQDEAGGWLVEHIDRLATMGGGGELTDAWIAVANGLVQEIGQGSPAERWAHLPRSSGRGTVGLPGLINAHHHFSQTLTRTLKEGQDQRLEPWLDANNPWWEQLDLDAVHRSSRVALAELALSGCSTTVDHMFAVPQHSAGTIAFAAAEFEAAKAVGIRLHLIPGIVDGGLHPLGAKWKLARDPDLVLQEMDDIAARFHDSAEDAMHQVGLGPDALSDQNLGVMAGAREIAHRRHLIRHTHCAQVVGEVAYCQDHYQMTPIERLDHLGWLGEDVLIAHAVQLTPADIERLASTRTKVAHCPSSNMRLAAGAAPLIDLLAAGVDVALGVDGSASGESGNLLSEARQAMLLSRVREMDRILGARQALSLLTLGGASALHRTALGHLAPGLPADLALFKMDGIGWAGMEHDPIAALVFGGPHRVDRLWVQGEAVVSSARLMNEDEQELVERHADAIRRIGAAR